MKTPIEPSDIREGDLIRMEWPDEIAHEYRAIKDGETRLNGSPTFIYILDRPTPAVDLPTEPTLGWLNSQPHLLAVWKDCSEGAVRPPCVRPVNVPTPFDDGHITAFTPATAVPTAALDELRRNHDCSGPLGCLREHVDQFIAAVDKANA